MDTIIYLLDIKTISFELLGYKVSYIELLGTMFGLSSVYFALRANILTWPTGVGNAFVFFALYYQVQLYSDMFLQLFFFSSSVYGWWRWSNADSGSVGSGISWLSNRWRMVYIALVLVFTVVWGYFMAHIHVIWPDYFAQAASFPFADAFTTVLSIAAMILMAYKKIDSWIAWIAIDIICIVLYYIKGIPFISLEYIVFLGMSVVGLLEWLRYWRRNGEADSGAL